VVGVAGMEHWPPGGPGGRGQQLVHEGDVGDGEAQGFDSRQPLLVGKGRHLQAGGQSAVFWVCEGKIKFVSCSSWAVIESPVRWTHIGRAIFLRNRILKFFFSCDVIFTIMSVLIFM
jgi:hypothetical protein